MSTENTSLIQTNLFLWTKISFNTATYKDSSFIRFNNLLAWPLSILSAKQSFGE